MNGHDHLHAVLLTADSNEALAYLLADRAVVADIESECATLWLDEPQHGRRGWLDTRHMLSPAEHAPQFIDMARQTLDYALQRELFRRHTDQPHLLLRIRDPK